MGTLFLRRKPFQPILELQDSVYFPKNRYLPGILEKPSFPENSNVSHRWRTLSGLELLVHCPYVSNYSIFTGIISLSRRRLERLFHRPLRRLRRPQRRPRARRRRRFRPFRAASGVRCCPRAPSAGYWPNWCARTPAARASWPSTRSRPRWATWWPRRRRRWPSCWTTCCRRARRPATRRARRWCAPSSPRWPGATTRPTPRTPSSPRSRRRSAARSSCPSPTTNTTGRHRSPRLVHETRGIASSFTYYSMQRTEFEMRFEHLNDFLFEISKLLGNSVTTCNLYFVQHVWLKSCRKP